MCPKDADLMANSVDPDQTSVCSVKSACPELSVKILTVKILKIWPPKKFAVITLKFEQDDFHREMRPIDKDRMAHSVDPDQSLIWFTLARPVCPKT